MPRSPVHRSALALLPLLLALSLSGCGQVGRLFMRMPDVEFPDQAPFEVGTPVKIFLPEGVTLPAPISATVLPAVATQGALPAATHAAPAAATHP